MLSRELSSLAKQINYNCPDRFVSGQIIEYDIKQANINMLYKHGIIDDKYYNYLKHVPKIQREIIIGNLIKEDKNKYKIIQDGIKTAKCQLFEANSIKEYEVVRIANDAVYINRFNKLNYTVFDGIEFVSKSISNCYLRLYSILFFINFENNINVDIKGLGEDYTIHQPIISIIVNIINELQCIGVKAAMKSLGDFIDDYQNRRLGVEYYREMNDIAAYRVIGGEFYISNLNNILPEIDINYNLYILRELSSILYEIYTSTYRKL